MTLRPIIFRPKKTLNVNSVKVPVLYIKQKLCERRATFNHSDDTTTHSCNHNFVDFAYIANKR